MRIIRTKKIINISLTTMSIESSSLEFIKRNAELEIIKYMNEVIRNHPICLFIKIPIVGIRARYEGLKNVFIEYKNSLF